ncbi:uncharacterized protein LOC126682091 [Mercurialis annua]|uniref:uncharacterized protein LOC126682091 n=1 Tax=Mercurialis annua TaxID=3986 RepID=UPI00215F3914|nr:uncharacterized protein LOC126682091 [Mercurialis annua]
MSYTFNFVSWNCRGGVTQFRKQRSIRSFVSTLNLSVIGLIETKRGSFDDFLIQKLWPNLDFDYCFSSSSGASGGLLCIWNSSLITPTRIIKSERWISADFMWFTTPIRFILVYANNCHIARGNHWNALLPEISCDSICILSGDFNEVLEPSERVGCSSFSQSMIAFSDFINSSGLLEIPLQGRFFTSQNSFPKSTLDRCFVSNSAFLTWPHIHLKALARSFSDHVPIAFSSSSTIDWGPRPFRSINAWWKCNTPKY